MPQAIKAFGLTALIYFVNLVVGLLFIALSPYSNGYMSTQIELSSVSGIAMLMLWKISLYWALALPLSFFLVPLLAGGIFIQLFPAFIGLFSERHDFSDFFNGLAFVLSTLLLIAITFFLMRRWNTSLKDRLGLKLGLISVQTICLNIILLFTFFASMSV